MTTNNTNNTKGLNDAVVASLKEKLESKWKDLAQQDHALRERLAAEDSSVRNTYVAGQDGAAISEVDDEVIAMIQHDRAELRDIQAALDRMSDGSYGQCTECGEDISVARLEVLPEASHCVACQDKAEHRHVH